MNFLLSKDTIWAIYRIGLMIKAQTQPINEIHLSKYNPT